MGKGFDLEAFKEALSDDKVHVCIAKVTGLELAVDKSQLLASVACFPELREIIAQVTWDAAGPDSGFFQFPKVGDLVMVAFSDGEHETAFVIKRLSSDEDTIPAQAATGDAVIKALKDQKVQILSNLKIFLGKGGDDPTEQLVLGTTFQASLSIFMEQVIDFITKYTEHQHIGNLGYVTDVPLPTNISDAEDIQELIQDEKDSPVDDKLMLSDHTFAEK